MATLLIRNLDDDVRDKLRVRAAEHGRSMEEEARCIIAGAIEGADDDPDAQPGSGAAVWERLRTVFADMGGVELPEFPDAPYEPPENIWGDDTEDRKE